MKLNQALLNQLQDATRQLLAQGPLAATATIQQALGGTAGAAPAPAPMRDLNPAPRAHGGRSAAAAPVDTSDADTCTPHAAQGAAHEERGTPPPRRQAPQRGVAPDARALVGDLLAKLGALSPDGKLPDLDLPGLDLPGMRQPRRAPPVPPGAQFMDGIYQGETGARHYKLYIPASYHGQAVPLVVMLHGCTQDPDDFAAGTRMNALAEEQGCLVVYPAQSQQANQQRCWNWFNALDQQRGQGEPAIIAGIARQVAAQYAVDAGQVYVAGMSAGGAMAVIVGTLYPDVFAAVGVHSGLPYASARDLPSALQAMKQGAPGSGASASGRPIIVFHGDRDHTVHPRNGEQVIAQQLHRHPGARAERDRGGVPDGHRYTRTTHRHPDGTPLGEHWVVHGAGHAWSGGSADGSYTDARGPDASREMLRFFKTVRA